MPRHTRARSRAFCDRRETAALWREAAITAGKHAGSSGDPLQFLLTPSPPWIGRWSLDTIGELARLGTEHSAPPPAQTQIRVQDKLPPFISEGSSRRVEVGISGRTPRAVWSYTRTTTSIMDR